MKIPLSPGTEPVFATPDWVWERLEKPHPPVLTTKDAYALSVAVIEEAWPASGSGDDRGSAEPLRPIPGLDEFVRDHAAWWTATYPHLVRDDYDPLMVARSLARDVIVQDIRDYIAGEAEDAARSARASKRKHAADPYADLPSDGPGMTFGDLVTMTGRSRRSVQDDVARMIAAGTMREGVLPTPSGGRPTRIFWRASDE